MMARTPSALIAGSPHLPSRQGAVVVAQLAPKSGSVVGPDVVSCSLNARKDNVRIPKSVRRREGPTSSCLGLLASLRLRALRNGALQDRPAPGEDRVHPVGIPVLPPGAALSRGGVQRAQLRQTFLLGCQRHFQRVGQLRVVHWNHPEPGLQLQDLYLSSGQFEIDCLAHVFLSYVRFTKSAWTKLPKEFVGRNLPSRRHNPQKLRCGYRSPS